MDGWVDAPQRVDDIEFVDNRVRKEVPEYEEFAPLLDRVLVRRIEAEAVVEGTGFVVPERYRQHTNRGEVVAIGQFVVMGNEVIELREFVQPGDIVLYGEYSAERFLKDDDVLWLVRLQDLRGVSRLKRG